MKQSVKQNIEQYITTWNLADVDEIKAGFEKCLSATCTYKDKNTPGMSGIKSFTDFVMRSHKIAPGRLFSIISGPEYFSHNGRYFWHVSFTDKPAKDCMDYFEFDDENKITAIVGFV